MKRVQSKSTSVVNLREKLHTMRENSKYRFLSVRVDERLREGSIHKIIPRSLQATDYKQQFASPSIPPRDPLTIAICEKTGENRDYVKKLF